MSFGISIENNQGIALLDDFSRQVQITKTVTGIVPGMSKHWNFWHGDFICSNPTTAYYSPSPCIIIPAEEDFENTAIFCRVKKTGSLTDNSLTPGVKPFSIQRGKCQNQITNVNNSTRLNSRMIRVTYDGPLVDMSGEGPGSQLSYDTTYLQGDTNNELAGYDLQVCRGNFYQWPDQLNYPMWYGFSSNFQPIGAFYSWGSYAGWLVYAQHYNLSMHPTGHRIEDFVEYE